MSCDSNPQPGTTGRPTLPFLSLRIKLLLFSSVLVLLPGILFGIIAYDSSRESLNRVIGRHLAREASNAADELESELTATRAAVRSFSRQPLMREIRVGDIDKRISTFLATAKEGDSRCLDLLLVGRNQRVIAASDPRLIGRLGSWAMPALQALDGAESFRGPVESPPHARSAVQIGIPVYDPDVPGNVLGALLGIYDWEDLSAVTEGVRAKLEALGIDADVLVLDHSGKAIRRALRQGSQLRGVEKPRLVASLDRYRMLRRVEPGFFVDENAQVLVGQAPVGQGPQAWAMFILEPLEDASRPVQRMGRQLAVALGATLVVALALTAVGAGRVVQPLTELTRGIQALARRGSSVTPVPVRTRDEVGALAGAFNRMASELDRAQHELIDAAKFAFVGEMAAGVAHEVRTPLGVLRNSAQILQRSLLAGPDKEAPELLQIICGEVDRIDRVVNDLLNLSRPRHLQLEPTLVAQTVFRAVAFVEAQAREKAITIVRLDSRSTERALCDPELIYQVALNLLVNAIQVLGDGGIIEAAVLPRRGSFVGFEIRDNGPGIPEELRRQVFRPFVTFRRGGTGLGLTFVQRVVQEHRGRLSLESEVGRGTCFRIELPLAEADE